MQGKFKQTWNSRSKKYVLINCSEGIKGGMTGKMSETPFEGVPIVNDKPDNNGSAEHQIETQENEKQQGKGASAGKDSNSAKDKELDDSGSGKDDSWWW